MSELMPDATGLMLGAGQTAYRRVTGNPIGLGDFKQYRRKQIAELRPYMLGESLDRVSISAEDARAGSPKVGDMIARNPMNHADQWLVAASYFAVNFDSVGGEPSSDVEAAIGEIEDEAEEGHDITDEGGPNGYMRISNAVPALRAAIAKAIDAAVNETDRDHAREIARLLAIPPEIEPALKAFAARAPYGQDDHECETLLRAINAAVEGERERCTSLIASRIASVHVLVNNPTLMAEGNMLSQIIKDIEAGAAIRERTP